MNYSDYRFTLDIQIHQAQVSVPATFGDSARKLCIGLTDGRKPYVIGEGCRAVFNAKKPDGNVIKNDCIIERNVILYEFTEQTTNSEGIVYCDITLYGADGKVLTSPQFTIVVDKRVVRNGEVVISEDQYTALDNIFIYEAQRQVAETARTEAEEARVDAETARDNAEQARIEAENNRAVGENLRKDAEDRRGEAEGARIQAENERIMYENARDAAEFGRNEAELRRDGAELGRIASEKGRADAEQIRISKETERQNKEAERQNKEAERQSNEVTRQKAEAERGNLYASAEAERGNLYASAETERDRLYGVAEDARDSEFNTKETARQTAFNNAQAERNSEFDDAQAQRQTAFNNAQTERQTAFNDAQAQRQTAFTKEQNDRASAWNTEYASREAQLKNFVNGLGIAQAPGDSESQVMSQKGATDLAKMITKQSDVTYLYADCPFKGYIKTSGDYIVSTNDTWQSTDYIEINEGSTIKGEPYGTTTVSTVAFYDENKGFISCISGPGDVFNIDTTPPEGAKYVRLSFLKSWKSRGIRITSWVRAVTEDNLTDESGDSKEKVMSQYGATKLVNDAAPVVKSRNLADIVFENANINVNNGVFTALTTGIRHTASPAYVPVIGGKSYTYSWELSNLEVYLYVINYDETKTFINNKMVTTALNEGTSCTLITPDNAAYVRLTALSPSGSTNPWEESVPKRLQMELGETATPYVKPKTIDSEALDAYKIVTPFIRFNYANYGLPVLEFEGNTSTMNKDNAVTLNYKYGDREGTCTLKWQGSSSLTYPKKNYTVKFDTAFEAKAGWGEQKKYCLKANYIDFSHSRNICSAKLWGEVVKSRTPANATLNALPNAGAIDGFPICVVINGEYKGIYTFNIPKDGWMFGMDKEAPTKKMAILCANGHDAASGSVALFRSLAECTDDLEIEYATDEDNTAWIKTSVNRLIQACINSDGTDLDTTIAQYLDWESAIDYYIFYLIAQHLDGVAKNYLLVTYDGTKWFFSAYDLDSTFGLYVNGTKLMPNDGNGEGYGVCAVGKSSHRIFELIDKYKSAELKARYKDLVEGYNGAWGKPLSEDRVVDTFYNFAGSIPKALLDEEVKIWTALPSTSVNNVSQIIDHYRRRRAFIDPQIEAL